MSGSARAPPPPAQIDSSWRYIADGIDRIMNSEDARALNGELYMNMYTAIHNFCVSPVVPPLSAPRTRSAEPAPGGELYRRLAEYLDAHLAELLRQAPPGGAALVLFYTRAWTQFQASAKYLDHIFSYLNRHWVKQERDDAARHKSVCEVYTLCLLRWRQVLYRAIAEPLIAALLAMIAADRNKQPVDTGALKQCVLSFHEIGVDAHLNKHPSLLFYTDEFEAPFLQATREYYTAEAQRVLASEGAVAYMRAVTLRLAQEEARVRDYLLPCTADRLSEVLETVLIADHQEELTQQFAPLVRTGSPDLRMLFLLLRKVRGGLTPVCRELADLVAAEGARATDDLAKSLNGYPVEPKAYIDTLLVVYSKYLCLLATSCDLSKELTEALEAGFARYINGNVLAGSGADCHTAELAARYADALLRRPPKALDDDAFASALNGVLVVLKHTDDKEAFERNYTRMLSRRLVQHTSASADREAQVVADLRNVCGFEYTNKLLRMFQDVNTSAKLHADFMRAHATPEAVSFQPLVLAEGFWPLPYRKVEGFTFPDECGRTFKAFNDFYTSKHSGRRLKWLWNFAKGEMALNLNDKSITLQVSAYQMAILDAFNGADTVTLETLRKRTKLPAELLEGSLASIVNAGILIEDAGGESYSFNSNFESKKNRLNLNVPMK